MPYPDDNVQQRKNTEQLPVFMILSTGKENNYPKFIKLTVIPVDNSKFMTEFFHMKAKSSLEKMLDTEGKTVNEAEDVIAFLKTFLSIPIASPAL